jgi:hypothetical protein
MRWPHNAKARFRPDLLSRERGEWAQEEGAAMGRSGASAKGHNAVAEPVWLASTSSAGRQHCGVGPIEKGFREEAFAGRR